MYRFILISTVSLIFLSSCTTILSTNIPGTAEKSLPKEWLGKYEVVTESKMPADKRDSADMEKEYALIESNRIIWTGEDGEKVFSLNDSLRYSVYGQSRYLSLLTPQGLYGVVKVIRRVDTLVLISMSSDDEPKKAALMKYFDKVEKIKSAKDEYFKVTINNKKLDAFFKSSIPSKEVTKLVPVK